MAEATPIRILEKENNRRGDLFGRLMVDLFVALGYEQPRLNIHKSGRELDLSADHRLESRRAIAECKATSEPIGGDDLNKFVGVLDAERGDKPVTGYFISLSGFKETAVEQEKKRRRRRTKIVTLTGPEAVDQLVKGNSLIEKGRAIEVAGRMCAGLDHLVLDPVAELLAHERGWIWAVYYTQGKARTHIALIHSDGTQLARAIADEVIAADRLCGGELHKLSCLNPVPPPGADTDPRVADALAAYRQYLVNECGYIQLDGLPADSDVGSRRLRLENLFVPLHLDVTAQKSKKLERQAVGTVLTEYPRLALLAAPGGGKSTLVKRLAVAYADPSRREQIADDLPPRDWLPLFFRCRELRDLARGSFAELLEALSQREPVRQHAVVFRALVDRALLAGRVLLLVDGLDEISDPGDRAAFVCTLRTALQAYPEIAIVATSREAGFRHVATHLAPVCTHATLSPFDEDDISSLSIAWHREVVGDTEKVRADAEQLAATIVRNDRINRLAANPLLLTTLLLVKRWVGSLPTRRAVLYGKAVEVLLTTWNTEGYEPIPDEEALPQLCYVASAMMLGGVQKVSRPRLATLLQEAREALPTELGYVKGTVDHFINRVDYRSSLLMMTGLDVEDGRLVEFFEFRHLTFQEFLTARAMVEGWHPGRRSNDTLADVLEPYFGTEAWREVIPLAAALGGKSTEGLLLRLTEKVSELDSRKRQYGNPVLMVLGNCLADEVAARPEAIREALRAVVRLGSNLESTSFIEAFMASRYADDFLEEARRAFSGTTDVGNAMMALAVGLKLEFKFATSNACATAACAIDLLKSSERLTRCEGALKMMYLCHSSLYSGAPAETALVKLLCEAGTALLLLLFADNLSEEGAAAWAFAWLGECGVFVPPGEPDMLGRLFAIWQRSPDTEVRRFAVWALGTQRLTPREGGQRGSSIPPLELQSLIQRFDDLGIIEQRAVLVVSWYRFALTDADLITRARKLMSDKNDPVLHELLVQLGEEPPRTRRSGQRSRRLRRR
jgi:NACHT domain-containing protein/restriction endonuclease